MAIDMFFKIDGIAGEATDDKHKDSIKIEAFTFGVNQVGASQSTGHGLGAGRAEFQDVKITKHVDKSSPPLMEHCATGKHIPHALITVRKADGKEGAEYYTVKFTDLLVSSFANTGDDDKDALIETIALNYSKVVFTYKPQDKSGNLGAPVVRGYDIKIHKAVAS